jgi:triosephosphate isomerase
MHLGPAQARAFAATFQAGFTPGPGRSYWFFPPAVSLEALATALREAPQCAVGAQDIFWEPKGAFTGALSAGLARDGGATLALVGHSERRHVFGETDPETARTVGAALREDLTPLLCLGEPLEQRESGEPAAVVLAPRATATAGLSQDDLSRVIIAYEPVWAIGTGRTASPADAATVHRAIRAALVGAGHRDPAILYGGSVNQGNVGALLAEAELDGVLVGGASLDPTGWRAIVEAA